MTIYDYVISGIGTVASIGVLIAGAGYFIGQWKSGSTKGKIDFLKLAEEQEKRLRIEIDNLNARLNEKAGIEQHLMNQVESLTKENQDLRKLVMLEQVPKPLERSVKSIVDESTNTIIKRIEIVNEKNFAILERLLIAIEKK